MGSGKVAAGLTRPAATSQVRALGKLNGYNRNTTAGKRSAVNLCLFPHKRRITINEGRLT